MRLGEEFYNKGALDLAKDLLEFGKKNIEFLKPYL